MQQSTLQPPIDENASLFPFHINLAQADVPLVNPQVTTETSQDAAVQNNADQTEIDIEEEIIEESEDPLPEDPGVMLLPDTIHEVIKIEILRETDAGNVNLEDDGSQELYRIYHNNNGFVQDQPRDLGIPPIEYPPQKLFVPFIPAQTQVPAVEPECCSSQVEIKLNTKLIYLGDYCCGYDGEEGEEYYYSGNYAWQGEGEGGSCGCGCELYNPPSPPTPNYTIIFNNCDGEQWLDITICTSYSESGRASFNIAQDASYDDCCTTYRVDIPASFGLDCDCPIVELKTDQLYIYSIYDLIYSNTQFFDCHGNCYEITTPYSSSGTFLVTELESSSSQFVLESCECECEQRIETILINNTCEEESGSPNYTLSFSTEYRDVNNDNVNDYIVNFTLLNNGMASGTASLVVDPSAGLKCPCLITEYIYDESQWREYVNDVTNGESVLTFDQAFSFIFNNGFFEDCQGNCYELGTVAFPQESFTGIVACTDCEDIELNVSFACDGCDTYNRFENWVANVAPGSFDPFKFFTDNFEVSLVDCNNTRFAEISYQSIDYSVGDGYYTTFDTTFRVSLSEDFCIDEFVEVVIDPKVIYQAYQDSCYQYGYDMQTLIGQIGEDQLHFVNTKTGDEYQIKENHCDLVVVPAACEEAICINLVNEYCTQQELRVSNLEASINDGGCGCCGGECDTQYDFKTESFPLSFNLEFIHSQASGETPGETIINFHYSIGAESGTFVIEASALGLGCTNPVVNLIFDETDLINSLTGDSKDLINFFVSNGMFEDCNGNCYEIFPRDIGDEGASPYVLQACTDCINNPITVSIDDSYNQQMLFTALAVNEVTDADKLAYFQNLYTLNYVECNGANFVEFTYYYNNSEEGCEYNSFPACCETVRISIEDCGSGEASEEGSSPITQLVLDCDFINEFFNEHFTDYCGNISYNIAQGWGSDFLNYLIDSESEFKTQDDASYLLNIDECGNYVIPKACENCCIDVPVNIALTNGFNSPYVRNFDFSTPIEATYTHVVGIENTFYHANLVLDATSEAGDFHNIYTNDFNFNFTYTNCDIDDNGSVDTFLTFNFANLYEFVNTSSSSSSIISVTNELITINAPENDSGCCTFELNFDEKQFADALMLHGFQVNPQN